MTLDEHLDMLSHIHNIQGNLKTYFFNYVKTVGLATYALKKGKKQASWDKLSEDPIFIGWMMMYAEGVASKISTRVWTPGDADKAYSNALTEIQMAINLLDGIEKTLPTMQSGDD